MKGDRVRDAVAGLEWVLAHEPSLGTELGNGKMVYVQRGVPFASTPELWVLYTYDADKVRLLRIRANRTSSPTE